MSFSVIQARSSPEHTRDKFALMPIHSLGRRGSDDKFDTTKLPFEIIKGVNIEDISALLRDDPFGIWKEMLGESQTEKIKRVKYALIYRYHPENVTTTDPNATLTLLSSCLRLIRPMRQRSLVSVHGKVHADNGTLDITGFDLAERQSGVEVVEAHKLSTLRDQDAETLRLLAPEFIRAIRGGFWKFRMAAQFHDLGYFQSYNWKPKFLLWCSALEALFTTHNRDHKGSRVAKARIKWFLGEQTRIYPQESWPYVIPHCALTIADVIDDLYVMRNYVAHGDKLPDPFFTTFPRQGINGGVTQAEALCEAASFIIRESLLKILRDGLLDHFADAAPAEVYFGAHGLTNSQLP
jgi:hypothetical protein